QVSRHGSFEHGTSTLRLARDVWASAEAERWRRVRAALLAARARRPGPGRDDKVVAAWNGLAIAALAETGALLGRPDLVDAAARCAALLVSVHVTEGARLRRVSRDGVAGDPHGVLEDYGDVAEGLLALHAVTGRPVWLHRAGALLETVLAHFRDADGAFHDTADDATDAPLLAVRRPQDPTDNAYPSGTTAAAGALLGFAAVTGSARHREAAVAALGAVRQHAGSAPRAFGWGLAVIQALLDGPREVAVVGPDGDPLRERLHRVSLAGTAPGLVVAVGTSGGADGDDPGTGDGPAPLLAGRGLVAGRAAAYVCRGFACTLPTSSAERLALDVGARVDLLA
ncbi:MAG TPA: N-acylglucosamine 2-epimerase, partial [Kineosporiaceae bacterium]